MPNTLADGASVEVKGHTLRRTGDVYACSCPAWRNQRAALGQRTCVHLRGYLGEAVELSRIGKGSGALVATADAAPALLLASPWDAAQDPTGWWMSEKLDGIRAYWDGLTLIARDGTRLVAPGWYVADLPPDPLDGVLWIGRRQRARVTSIVRSAAASRQWREVTFAVVDAPLAAGVFEERLGHARRALVRSQSPHARVHEHVVCTGLAHLRAEFGHIAAAGGDGLMLRAPGAPYHAGVSSTLLDVPAA